MKKDVEDPGGVVAALAENQSSHKRFAKPLALQI